MSASEELTDDWERDHLRPEERVRYDQLDGTHEERMSFALGDRARTYRYGVYERRGF